MFIIYLFFDNYFLHTKKCENRCCNIITSFSIAQNIFRSVIALTMIEQPFLNACTFLPSRANSFTKFCEKVQSQSNHLATLLVDRLQLQPITQQYIRHSRDAPYAGCVRGMLVLTLQRMVSMFHSCLAGNFQSWVGQSVPWKARFNPTVKAWDLHRSNERN